MLAVIGLGFALKAHPFSIGIVEMLLFQFIGEGERIFPEYKLTRGGELSSRRSGASPGEQQNAQPDPIQLSQAPPAGRAQPPTTSQNTHVTPRYYMRSFAHSNYALPCATVK